MNCTQCRYYVDGWDFKDDLITSWCEWLKDDVPKEWINGCEGCPGFFRRDDL